MAFMGYAFGYLVVYWHDAKRLVSQSLLTKADAEIWNLLTSRPLDNPHLLLEPRLITDIINHFARAARDDGRRPEAAPHSEIIEFIYFTVGVVDHELKWL